MNTYCFLFGRDKSEAIAHRYKEIALLIVTNYFFNSPSLDFIQRREYFFCVRLVFIGCFLFQLFHRHGDGWMYNNHMKLSVKPNEEQASSASTEPTE